MDSSLSLDQFQKFMGVIRLMLDKIEQEQTNKLRSMNDQSKGQSHYLILKLNLNL